MTKLFIDTSQPFLIIGLLKDGSCYHIIERHNHSLGAALSVKVVELLTRAEMGFQDLSEIIVGAGPGSYTGTRVGVAFAEGLGYGLGVPVKKLPSLAFYLLPNQDVISLRSTYGQIATLSVLGNTLSYKLAEFKEGQEVNSLKFNDLRPSPDFSLLATYIPETPISEILYFQLI